MYSVPMAVVDYFPVLFFGLAAYLLQKDLYNKMSKGAYALFCAGTIDVFVAGLLKATHKLLYALNICDFEPLYSMFFPTQALGFLMCGTAMICLLLVKQGKGTMYAAAVAPTVFKGTMIFVILMIYGVIGYTTSLGIIASRMGKKKVSVLFVVSCIAALMMGYLSSKDFANPLFNWLGEAINLLGQLSLYIGVKILDKAGLDNFRLD